MRQVINCNKCEFCESHIESKMKYCNKYDHKCLNYERRQGQKAPDWCPLRTNVDEVKKRRKQQGYFYV